MRAIVILGWVVFLTFLLWPFLRWMLRPRLAPPGGRALRDELVKDPVCQTYVVRSRAVTRTAGGALRYFCSRECAVRFAGEGKG